MKILKLFFNILLIITFFKSITLGQNFKRIEISSFYSNGSFYDDTSNYKDDSILVINKKGNWGKSKDTLLVKINFINSNLFQIKVYNRQDKSAEHFNIYKKMQEGEYSQYNKVGELISRAYYHRGKEIFPASRGYYISGGLESAYNIDRDERKGEYIYYYESGAVDLEEFFNDSSESPIGINYYETGELKSKSYGPLEKIKYFECFQDGNIKTTGMFYETTMSPIGEWIEYYNNGKIKSLKYYEFVISGSVPVGQWKYFDETGKLEKTEDQQ